MSTKISGLSAERILSERLVGDFAYRVELGDYDFQLTFSESGLALLGQNVVSSHERELQRHLDGFSRNLQDATDGERVAKATLLSAAMRRQVVSVSVGPAADVTLVFEGGIDIRFSTDIDVVDWQWQFGPPPVQPYRSPYVLACFWKGEILVGEGTTSAA